MNAYADVDLEVIQGTAYGKNEVHIDWFDANSLALTMIHEISHSVAVFGERRRYGMYSLISRRLYANADDTEWTSPALKERAAQRMAGAVLIW